MNRHSWADSWWLLLRTAWHWGRPLPVWANARMVMTCRWLTVVVLQPGCVCWQLTPLNPVASNAHTPLTSKSFNERQLLTLRLLSESLASWERSSRAANATSCCPWMTSFLWANWTPIILSFCHWCSFSLNWFGKSFLVLGCANSECFLFPWWFFFLQNTTLQLSSDQKIFLNLDKGNKELLLFSL